MVRLTKTVLSVLLAFLCLAELPAAASQKPRSHAKPSKVKVEPAPQPAVPPRPPTPQQLPPSPPQVSYRDGLLTIHAQNSTLADILAAVRAQTGATIDMPAQGGNERVFFHQGPGPARDILAALLQGSAFDYILLGSLERPGDLQRILLLPRPTGAETTAAAGPPPAPTVVPNPNPDLDESNEEGVIDESSPAPEPAAPEPVLPTPSPQPKTPEQLLEELRQQQQRLQQQQQQQQQQNPPPQPPD